ncbi:MAG: S-layer homology domain-containing protein [bacterium]
MRRNLFTALVVCFLSAAVFAAVDISEIGMGARPIGLGRTFSAGIDDASAIFCNPAALDLNRQLNIISMSGTILTDVNYVMAGASENSPLGKLGIGYVSASIGGIPITQITGTGSSAAVVQTGLTDYSNSIIFLSLGSRLSRFLRGGTGENVLVGLSLKIFQQGFTGGGSTMQNAVGSGADLDCGLIWQVNPWASLGLSLKNCLPEAFGGRFKWQESSQYEGIALSTRYGGQFRLIGYNGWQENHEQELTLSVDHEQSAETSRPAVWHVGSEFWPVDILAFRAGIDQRPKATVSGIGVDNNLTAGIGLKYFGFTFDYAYHQFGELAENSTHFFSFGYRGRDNLNRSYEQERRGKGFVPMAEVVAKPKLVTFSDLPNNYWARKPIEYLASLRIMGGYPDGTFRPDQKLSRGELAVLLVKAKEFKTQRPQAGEFRDVKPGNWMSPYIAEAVKRNYMGKFPDGNFYPGQAVTRAEAAVIFSKYSGLYVKPRVLKKAFPDVPEEHWASPAIAATKNVGFFEYLIGKRFEPKHDITRAEAAELLSKAPYVRKKIKSFITGER